MSCVFYSFTLYIRMITTVAENMMVVYYDDTLLVHDMYRCDHETVEWYNSIVVPYNYEWFSNTENGVFIILPQ